MNNSTISYFGERGLINSIILDINGDIEKQKKFLKSIMLVPGKTENNNKLLWADDAVEFNWLIELALSEFGRPDLLLFVTTSNKTKYALFIEAKLHGYDSSSVPFDIHNINKNEIKDCYKGIASKLNIQLAFKFRFIKAMYTTNQKTEIIEESDEIAKQYKDKKRRLHMRKVCEYIKKLFVNIDPNNIYYIALTNDNENIKPFDNEETLPAISKDNWENNSNKFGYLTYKSLLSEGVLSDSLGYYSKTKEFLFDKSGNIELKDLASDETLLNSINREKWTELQEDLAEKMKSAIENIKCELKLNSFIIFSKKKGSYSYVYSKKNNKVIMKILSCRNKNNSIIFGIRNDNNVDKFDKSGLKKISYMLGGGNRQSFLCYFIYNEKEIKKISKTIKEYLENINFN